MYNQTFDWGEKGHAKGTEKSCNTNPLRKEPKGWDKRRGGLRVSRWEGGAFKAGPGTAPHHTRRVKGGGERAEGEGG